MSKSKAQAETMSGVDFPVEMFDELEAYISTLDDKQGSLIHVLHKAQNIFGYLPREVQLHIARKLDIIRVLWYKLLMKLNLENLPSDSVFLQQIIIDLVGEILSLTNKDISEEISGRFDELVKYHIKLIEESYG